MLKNKSLWLKAAAALALAFPSVLLASGIGAAPAKDGGGVVISELLCGKMFSNPVSLPDPGTIALPEAPVEKVQSADKSAAPAPGREFTPVIQDAARVQDIMKLLSDICGGVHLPYSQDGATFTNREGRLPVQPMGYYKEYTLLTGDAPHVVVIGGTTYQVAPDLSARGSERIIIGGGEHIYYTPDHYAHFILLTVVR